jgi:hypothetical protein
MMESLATIIETKMAKEKVVVETPEVKIAEISRAVAKVEKEAQSIVVTNKEQYEGASKFLSSTLKPYINRVNELVKFFTDPYVEQRRIALAKKQEIEELFNKQLSPLLAVETEVKKSMGNYLRQQEESARQEEARLAKLREKQNERREEKGQEPVATPLPTVERVAPTVKNEDGGKTVAKKVWKFELENSTQLPKEVVAEILTQAHQAGIYDKVIRKMVASGVHEMSGVRIWEDFDISATTSK